MSVTVFNMPESMAAAFLVIGGQFGSGEERKAKLTKAGYNPTSVQSCVNDLLPIIKKYGG